MSTKTSKSLDRALVELSGSSGSKDNSLRTLNNFMIKNLE